MNILIVNPANSVNFYKYLKLIFKKAFAPPLGILTAAAVLPADWKKKFVDLNVKPLKDSELIWADYVFMGGIFYQQDSMTEIVRRAKKINKKVIAGGSLITRVYRFYEDYKPVPEEFHMVDHYVLGEAEITLKEFLRDLNSGKAKKTYDTAQKADINFSPAPLWDIVDFNDYFRVPVQYSKGCPHGCEFCDIGVIDGCKHRTKKGEQIIKEFDHIYDKGWRGTVCFVDDNFVFNRELLKKDLFPELKDWMEKKNFPFTFDCMATTDLSNDPDILRSMNELGFKSVFIGIETTNKASLLEFTKTKNMNVDLEESVAKIQSSGLLVHSGIIMGFDNDDETMVEELSNFIIENGLVFVRVNPLTAPPGTKLFNRLKKEERLLDNAYFNVLRGETNFRPKMGHKNLSKGFEKIIKEINSPENFKKRVLKLMGNIKGGSVNNNLRITINALLIFVNVALRIGFFDKRSGIYRKIFIELIREHPDKLEIIISAILYWHSSMEFYEKEAGLIFDIT